MEGSLKSPFALVVDGVTKHYGSRTAVDDVSLSVAPGEFAVLLGPNGAGKTTLFQLLTGLSRADDGSVRLNGADMKVDSVGALRSIGVVFQEPTVDRDLTVLQNLRFHCRLHGLRGARAKQRVDEALARHGLSDRGNDPVHALSGGNRRRVELARALLHSPQVLLMDEATVGLDPVSRRRIVDDTVCLAREEGIAVLWATHLVDEAERCDRVIVLHQGHVLADQPPTEVASKCGAADLYDAFVALTSAPTRNAPGRSASEASA